MTTVVKWCALCRDQAVHVDATKVQPDKDYFCKDCMPMRHWYKRTNAKQWLSEGGVNADHDDDDRR